MVFRLSSELHCQESRFFVVCIAPTCSNSLAVLTWKEDKLEGMFTESASESFPQIIHYGGSTIEHEKELTLYDNVEYVQNNII